MDESIKKRLDQLEKDFATFKAKRITQEQVIPGSIKMRAMGEANRFVRGGLAANRPTAGETTSDGLAFYYETDTKKLKIYDYDNEVWREVTLT